MTTCQPMAPIAGNLIQTKRYLERDLPVLPTKVFEGFGTDEDQEEENKDPTARLKALVKAQYKNEHKHNKIVKKQQSGGLAPLLIPVGIALASALGSKIVGDLYDFVKGKIVGSGHEIPKHKTKKDQLAFIKEIVNYIK